MKFKIPYLVVLFSLFFIFSCEENQAPTCTIISPKDGEEIEHGQIVNIVVNTEDSDGHVTEVCYYVNSNVGSSSYFPYSYKWNTSGEETGVHLIVATSKDNDGKLATDEIQINLVGVSKPNILYDNRDKTTYKIVQIGTQVWMAENLNYETSSGSWIYHNIADNASTYGRLYNWETANIVCPNGWHLPSHAEWSELESFIGYSRHYKTPGTALKATSGWNSGGNGTDDYGFCALPGGSLVNGTFSNVGNNGFWWSNRQWGNEQAFCRSLVYNSNIINNQHFTSKSYGYSVRCVRD